MSKFISILMIVAGVCVFFLTAPDNLFAGGVSGALAGCGAGMLRGMYLKNKE